MKEAPKLMARGDGLEDLRTAREFAEQARQAVRKGEYVQALAVGSVGSLYLGLAGLAVQVLAESSVVPQGADAERVWRRWRAETGGDLR